MAVFQPNILNPTPPWCHGNSQIRSEGRECLRCPHQSTCNDKIRGATPLNTTYTPPFQPYTAPQPYAASQAPPRPAGTAPPYQSPPYQSPPWQAPNYYQPPVGYQHPNYQQQYQQVQYQQPQYGQQYWQAQQPYPQPPKYGFGWLNDPLYYMIDGAPTPLRPQMDGESFWEAFFKAAFLKAMEALAKMLLLLIRQAVLAPKA